MLWTPLVTLAFALTAAAAGHGRIGDKQRARIARHAEMQTARHSDFRERTVEESEFRFLNNKSKEYKIESLPYVDYDIGEMYSGLIPVADSLSRALFFVFQPKVGSDPVDEVTIWFNGGPGCSSLEGFFQENGLFRWEWGVYRPLLNPYSWVNLTNMLWVEQPVGTGFSPGKVTATNELDVAADFISWFKNFQDVFGIKNFKIYITGESYAGRYVPYVSAGMLDKKDKEYYDLSGALVYDPCIGSYEYVQEEATAYPFIVANQVLFNFNESFMAHLESLHKSCGYEAFIEEYLVFPAKKVQPPKKFNYNKDAACDIADIATNVALAINPCFNPYELSDMCPLLWDVLGFPTILEYTPPGWKNYFDQPAVKKAMHAPMDVAWGECSAHPVFVGEGGPEGAGDSSPDPIQHVLPQVIEATNRVLVANGDYDMVIITEGTLISIQNMTWNGKLGFETKPTLPVDIKLPDLEYKSVFAENGAAGLDGPQGIMGIQHQERGLLFSRTYQSGHMQPQFQSRVAYRHLQWVLGHIDEL